MNSLEKHFKKFRKNIIGINKTISTPYGKKRIIYADWIASGRLYKEIEQKVSCQFGPYLGNTHSESSETGQAMTLSYAMAKQLIKEHVNGNENDTVITTANGMTGVMNKFQRMLGIRLPEKIRDEKNCLNRCIEENDRPVVFITHMEHHSNQISWLETIADVVILTPADDLTVNPLALEDEIRKYKGRKIKIGSFTACSNVTGLRTPYHELAKIMHKNGGLCFVDFAASAPYDSIDMHPEDPMVGLDAIMFSPHKFLGGPGSCGVLVFDRRLISNSAPDVSGGGTVSWTTRWNEYKYFDSFEHREDGGTPAFMQAIKVALVINLKEKMGIENIHKREKELLNMAFTELEQIENLNILQPVKKDRLGVISFYIEGIHHNLVVKLLNDKFGIQVRGGCSCAGTFGHYLFDYSKEESGKITREIDKGNLIVKPGWVRLSLHPTMTNKELRYILKSIGEVSRDIEKLSIPYAFEKSSGEYYHSDKAPKDIESFRSWFAV